MAEFTGVFVQQVAAGQNVIFTETPVSGSKLRRPPRRLRHRYPAWNDEISAAPVTRWFSAAILPFPPAVRLVPSRVVIAVEGEALGRTIGDCDACRGG